MITPDIRKIEREELPLVRDLAPPEWELDMEKLYRQHYDQPYFYPTVTMLGANVAGVGMANVHSNCAWIGTIIVKEAYRNKGIGAAITHHLIDHSLQRGMETIILSASHAGLAIYEKMGFVTDSEYVFFRPGALMADANSRNGGKPAERQPISPITEKDFLSILELDRRVSGEDRKGLLFHTMGTGFKYADEGIKGYYLPDFGKGLVIADTDAAGLGLLKYKIARERSSVCIPEANAAAAGLLAAVGYEPYLRATRMFLHRNIQWDATKVYARGSGALG